MAYTRTTWNNLSDPPINAENLNKIEQGIYNNSLGIDKINPSGTATTTAEIEEGQINDVIGFKSLKLKGQTSQYTTTGKNKLEIIPLTTQTVSGVTFTPVYNGNKLEYINVNGTASSTASYYLQEGNVNDASTYVSQLPSGTYILDDFSGSSSVNVAIYLRYTTDNSTYTALNSVATTRKFTVNSNFKYTSYIRIASGETVNNMKFYPQLETGSTQTTYEPYTNGASPNPDFPQDVNNVSGYNIVGISNKNIANSNDIYNGYPIGNIGGTIGFNSSVNSITYKKCAYVNANQQYTLSWKINTPKSIGGRDIKIVNDSNIILENFTYSNANNNRTETFTPTQSGWVYVSVDANATEVQIEVGNSVTSYKAHQGNNFEINLGKNLFNKNSNIVTPGYLNASGEVVTSDATLSYQNKFINVKPNTTYTISSDTSTVYRIAEYNSSQTFISRNLNTYASKSYSFTTSNNTHYIKMAGTLTSVLNSLQIEVGSTATSYTPYFTPIEICKIGTAQDYVYRKNGRWYVYKAIRRAILDGTNNYAANKSSTTNNTLYVTNNISNIKPVANNGVLGNIMSSHFKAYTTDQLFSGTQAVGISKRDGSGISLAFGLDTELTTKELVNAWLAEVKPVIYYEVLTPTIEEITYEPLIRQLDELYNSGLYDVTNISQDNSSEAFILDLEACKNNINGIVEYIRR